MPIEEPQAEAAAANGKPDDIRLTGGGIEGGPQDGEIQLEENILVTGVSNEQSNIVSEIEQIENMLEWQTMQQLPTNEFDTPGILARTFPTLFLYGIGDPFDNSMRTYSVSLHGALSHICRYARRNERGDLERSYDRNPRFMHYRQDMDERHRIPSQASFFVKEHQADADLSLNAMQNMQPEDKQSLMKKIQRQSSNISGSDSYFKAWRRELQSLIEQRGSAMIWFTLSYSDAHWQDLLQTVPGLLRGDSVPFPLIPQRIDPFQLTVGVGWSEREALSDLDSSSQLFA